MRLLLAAPAIQVNPTNVYGNTPLHQASWAGHAAVVQLLLAAHDIQVNPTNDGGDTPLMLASDRGHAAVVELLSPVN